MCFHPFHFIVHVALSDVVVGVPYMLEEGNRINFDISCELLFVYTDVLIIYRLDDGISQSNFCIVISDKLPLLFEE